MKKNYLLSLDYGSQSIRALVFDTDGRLIAKSQIKSAPLQSPVRGWAEQSADDCWRQLGRVLNQLWQQGDIAPAQLAALSLTTQRNCVVHLGADKQVLREVIMWPDSRRAEAYPSLSRSWRWIFRLVGIHDRIRYFQQESEINWVDHHQPDIASQAQHICFLSGYLHYQLTGNLIDSTASQVGYIPFDYRRSHWAGKRDWRWQAIAASPEQMIQLVNPGELLGRVSAKAALLTGLPVGLGVIASGADKACEALAAGGTRPDVACISLGTAATVAISQRTYREAYRYLPPYPALMGRQHINEIQLQRGFWLLSHFIEQYGAADVSAAKRLGLSTEAYLCSRLIEVAPGCDGLMVQPFWSPGVIYPGPEARGAIVGFTPEHGRMHLYRALIEGILFSLKQGLERLQKIAPQRITLVRVSGGGAQSEEILQMAADILQLPCERLPTHETSGLGAAIVMAHALGHYDSMEAACERMIGVKDRFEPDPQTSGRYQAIYRQQARGLYQRIRPLYQRQAESVAR